MDTGELIVLFIVLVLIIYVPYRIKKSLITHAVKELKK